MYEPGDKSPGNVRRIRCLPLEKGALSNQSAILRPLMSKSSSVISEGKFGRENPIEISVDDDVGFGHAGSNLHSSKTIRASSKEEIEISSSPS